LIDEPFIAEFFQVYFFSFFTFLFTNSITINNLSFLFLNSPFFCVNKVNFRLLYKKNKMEAALNLYINKVSFQNWNELELKE